MGEANKLQIFHIYFRCQKCLKIAIKI